MNGGRLLAYLYLATSLLCCSLYGADTLRLWSQEDLMRDLTTVREIDRRLSNRMPTTYNFFQEAGYFQMPSALVGSDGSVSVGYSSVPPYQIYGARIQFFDRVELVTNYRVFKGVPDPVLTKFGFGDFSDKGANFKVAVFRPEDSEFQLPGLAFGMQDFTGTKQFRSVYFVATQVWPQWNIEASLGYGWLRINGFLGGVLWTPFRQREDSYLKGLSFAAELDGTEYEDPVHEPHPRGRNQKHPINYGIKYRLWKYFDMMVSHVRGEEIAAGGGFSFPLGTTEGLLTKVEEPMPYQSPTNTEALGLIRPPKTMMHSLLYALQDQGFTTVGGWLGETTDGKPQLRLRIIVDDFRRETDVRIQLQAVLSKLVPSNIAEVIIGIDNQGLVVHEYRFKGEHLRRFRERGMSEYELAILSPLQLPTSFPHNSTQLLFQKNRSAIDVAVTPRTRTYFGSSRGKFKYSLGVALTIDGYLWQNVYYLIELGKTFLSNLDDVNDTDMLNPSQIINVRTDAIRYQQNDGIIVDAAYLQKSWHVCRGLYTRVSAGHFEEAYGGGAWEALYMPLGSCWALGWESAVLRKREYTGIGFSSNVRRLTGFQKSYEPFSPHQHFLDFYLDLEDLGIEFKASGGRFLAKDYGVRFEATRVFPSGFMVSLWYTHTSGKDFVNGDRYHDRGVSVSVPLDILFEKSSRRRWNYGLSAWLRDVGVRSETGARLYQTIKEERRN